MSRPDPIARALVEAAFELHRRRLWLEVPSNAPVLIRVPGEEHALTATVIGHLGRDYGLIVLRGEDSFRQMVRTILESDDQSAPFEAAILLSVTLEALGEIPPELRGVLAAAGFQARRENLAPHIFAKTPHRPPRAPNRSEMRLLLACLRAVFAAHDADELHPKELSRRRKQILELAVEGGGSRRDAKVRVRRVAWPEIAGVSETAPTSGLGDVDPSLARTDERWLAAYFLTPGATSDDGRNLYTSVVAVAGSNEVLDVEVVPSGETEPVARQLESLFRGDEDEDEPPYGLPREIVFGSADLHRALAPGISALGVEATLDPEDPALVQFMDKFGAGLEGIAKLVEAEKGGEDLRKRLPQTLGEWKEADRIFTRSLLDEVLEQGLLEARAIARFFGSAELGREVLKELEQFQPQVSLVEWLIADNRTAKQPSTHLERLLRQSRTTPAERVLIEGRIAARLSIFRVDSAVPGATLEVEDVLDGKRFTVQERGLSGCGVEGLFLPLRLSRVAEWTFLSLAGPPLSALEIGGALERLESLGVELSPAGLRRSPHLVGRLWERSLARQTRLPILNNTDGEPLLWHTATFNVSDVAALERALHARAELDYDEKEGNWTWLRPGGPAPGFGDNTVLGRLELIDDRLVLEVNSAGRLARARAWLDPLPGVRFERATTREFSREALAPDDKLRSKPMPPSPELTKMIEEMHRQHCRRWIDEPVPALGGLTPRQAWATPDGRRRVERLLRTMPAVKIPGGSMPSGSDEILRELQRG